jgi:hypothetical protein
MTRLLPVILLATLGAGIVRADTGDTNLTGSAILERVHANRALKDFSLKARLFVTRDEALPAEIFVSNTPEETRTIYQVGDMRLLVVQPVRGKPRFFLRGAGELAGCALTNRLAGSSFSFYDLGTPFLWWPAPKLTGEDRIRGRNCFLLETEVAGQPYARAKMWIDREYFGLLRAEIFDESGRLVKRFAVTSFKRVGDAWIPRGLEMADLPAGQTLPAQEKSRLEVYEGEYDAKLPDDLFLPGR